MKNAFSYLDKDRFLRLLESIFEKKNQTKNNQPTHKQLSV